jgi:hypothetical protein
MSKYYSTVMKILLFEKLGWIVFKIYDFLVKSTEIFVTNIEKCDSSLKGDSVLLLGGL